MARATIDELLARGVLPVLVGGSGLYLRAALDELSFPGIDPALRATLEAELEMNGALALHARLAALDAAAASRMEPTNGRRVVRALEVVLLTGAMPGGMTSYQAHYDVTYLGLDRDDLAERTDARVDRMWAAGLVDEVKVLEQQGLRDGVTASRALGYAQVLTMLDGAFTEDEAVEATKVATRRFVRRQRAWFRRDPRIRWLHPAGDLREQGMAVLASK
jgi:tRNA dimethylallyltransferase